MPNSGSEVIYMGKIFKLIGNFEQNGKWAKPRPNFTGKIAAEEGGYFYGYCYERYDSDQPDANKIRYLFGQLRPCEDSDGFSICFLKLSNYGFQTPLLYFASDNNKTDACHWMSFRVSNLKPHFVNEGKADLQIEELPYLDEDYQKIRNRFYLDLQLSLPNIVAIEIFSDTATSLGLDWLSIVRR